MTRTPHMQDWQKQTLGCRQLLRPCRTRLIPVLLIVFISNVLFAVETEFAVGSLLQEHCHSCHGPDKQKGALRLDQRASMLRGGDSGEAAVVPGDPAASFLIKLVRHEEDGLEMPPKKPQLRPVDIERLETWIRNGAKTPASYGPDKEAVTLTHWAFRPVVRPADVDGIDDLVRRGLAEAGLTASESADRRTLIRRLYLVMLGLPPTPEQVDAFLADTREDAWPRRVDEVLASAHYGERWASHWLDLVRFGETNGFETNRERPTAWPYRDWVIEAFNSDKPYNDFVREQLAGDRLGAPLGTAFIVAGPVDIVKGQDPRLNREQRANELDDMINTSGTAFLGLSTGCARCHNHKFDPISQKDYYAMKAVFAGVKHGEQAVTDQETSAALSRLDEEITDLSERLRPFERQAAGPPVNAKHNVDRFPPTAAKMLRFTINNTSSGEPCIDELEIFSGATNLALATRGAVASSGGDFVHALHRLSQINDGKYGNPRSWIAKQRSGGWVQVEFPAVALIDRVEWSRDRQGMFGDRLATDYRIEGSLDGQKWTVLASSADRQPFGSKAERTYNFEQAAAAEALRGRGWLERLKEARQQRKAIGEGQKAWVGLFSQPGPVHRLYRGDIDMPREEVGPGAIDVFVSLGLGPKAPEAERRLALANWIAADDNPLTARVMANRLWQFHFGVGLVDTPSDFGLNGTPPSHPALLDWLAAELVAGNWSLKQLHRRILLSATWQQSSRPRPAAVQIDAASRLLWRFPPRRLEAEAIRDSILAASGVLDLDVRGGPGFSPFKVQMENVRHYHPKESYGPADWRRMIYMTKVRQEREHVFGAFDCPDASMVVPKRSRSTTPLQALNLLNSNFVMQQAGLFAQRLEADASTPRDRVKRAWHLCFQRPPSPVDLKDSLAFIEAEGLLAFCRAMLNANEFVFIP